MYTKEEGSGSYLKARGYSLEIKLSVKMDSTCRGCVR